MYNIEDNNIIKKITHEYWKYYYIVEVKTGVKVKKI